MKPAPPAPRVPTAAEKREAQDLAIRSANLLDEGKQAEAKAQLEKAQALDPNNALAATLMTSITADPVATLGAKSFRYPVRPGDKLSKLSEQYLKDQYKFYLLARYNNIEVPRGLQVGQVIRIPGTGPIQPATAVPTAARTPLPKQPAPAEAERLYQEGARRLQAGEKDGAYDLFTQAARLDPRYRAEADRVRTELVSVHDRKARDAYKRQDLDVCIREWTRVLELDPANETARLERQRAQDLQAHLDKVN